MKKTLLFAGCFLLVLVQTRVAWGTDTLAAVRQNVAQGYYDSALAAVGKTLKARPKDVDALLLEAQIHGWQKSYAAAENEFDSLLADNPGNSDILAGRGYLYYAENKLDAAEQDFNAVLRISPDYEEARQGLQFVQKAKDDPEDPFKWQADVGSEFSTFARAPQTNWDNEFVQLTRHFAQSGTAAHFLAQRYHQFEQTDTYYEVGADQRFTPYLNGYLYGGGTPGPAFRPRWHVAAGGNVRVVESSPKALWITLDTRYDDYASTEVGNLDPGLRVEFADNWALGGMMISVLQSGAPVVFGWQGRLDGQIQDGWRFNAGYAAAPETVAGVTVNTQTVFAGMAIDIGAANTINFGYTHDDRDNSYIRHAINASLSHRF